MKRLLVLSALAAAAVLACFHPSASASPAGVTRPRVTGPFTRIDLRSPVDVFVHEGRPLAVSLTTKVISPDKVVTRVEGDALIIEIKNDWCIGNCPQEQSARLDIDTPVLNGVKISGSGDVAVVGAGTHAKLDLAVTGSGDIRYSGAADLVSCSVEGSGDVTLSGSGKRIQAKLEGSGDVDARAFAVSGGAFEIDGSGDVTADLHGGDTTIRIHGSGDLHYSGEARITSLEIEGSGEVSRL